MIYHHYYYYYDYDYDYDLERELSSCQQQSVTGNRNISHDLPLRVSRVISDNPAIRVFE
jgi:hypothetical protein